MQTAKSWLLPGTDVLPAGDDSLSNWLKTQQDLVGPHQNLTF